MRNRWATVLKIGVTLLGLGVVLARFDVTAVAAALSQVQPGWLLASFLLVNASLVLRAFRWLRLVRGLGLKISFGRLVALYFVGSFFNAFLPSGFGGDVVRVVEAAQDAPAGAAAGTVIVDRLTGLLTLFLLALLALPFRPAAFPASLAQTILLVSLAGLLGGLVLLEGSWLRRVGRRLPGPFTTAGEGFVAQAVRAVAECGRRAVGEATAVSILFNLMQAAWWACTGRALGLELPFITYLLVVPLFALLLLLPSIGGLGVRESLAPLLLPLGAAQPEQAIALVFLIFVQERLSGLLGGPVYLYTLLRK
jgi:glycosyltransferase 2 family protein